MVVFKIQISDFFENVKKRGKKDTYYDSKKLPTFCVIYDASKSEKCWYDHCKLPLGEPGMPMPVKKIFNPSTKSRDEYVYYGWFCSYECMMALASSNESRPYFRDSMGYIAERFMEDYPDESFESLVKAPALESLKDYGGDLTIKEFRGGNHPRIKKSNHFIISNQVMETK